MVKITHVRYLAWEDAFDVEFADGLSFLEPHETVRLANRISAKAMPVEVTLEPETHLGFEVCYDTDEVAEVSWAFVRELAPKEGDAQRFLLGAAKDKIEFHGNLTRPTLKKSAWKPSV